MDSLLKAIHSHHEHPEAEFVPLVDGSMHTYMGARANFTYQDFTESTCFTSYQPMTPLGKMSAYMNSASNQVPLLVNMLRYVMLRRLCAASPGQEEDMSSSLGQLTENGVDVCLDYPFGEDYPETNHWDWPCCNEAAAIPRYTHMGGPGMSPRPVARDHYIEWIDLSGQSTEGVAFVLLMLAGWTRRSRYRLDFSLGKLTDHVHYKNHCELTGAAGWSNTTGERTSLPKLPSWRAAWEATKTYIDENSLYSQFSTALYLVSAAMYQFRPVTIEAATWLAVKWTIALPGFSSVRCIRDGYVIEGGGGDGKLRSSDDKTFSEWRCFSEALERINLLALTFSQAYHTGLGVRACRLGLDEKDSIHLTRSELYVDKNFISVAAAEALKMPVPSSGMSNAYLYCEDDLNDYDASRVVVTDVTSDDTRSHPAYKWALDDYAPVNNRRWDVRRTPATRCKAITLPRMVLPGLPNLLLPLDAFPQPSPWNMTGSICRKEQGRIRTTGWEVSAYEAWVIANFVHTFKGILELRDNKAFTTNAGFYMPAATNFTFPLLHLQGQKLTRVVLSMIIEEQPGTTLVFPDLTTPFFQGRLTYNTRIMSRGVSSTTTSRKKFIRG